LHDFGKVYVDERVSRQPGKLSPTEFEQNQQGCRRVLGTFLGPTLSQRTAEPQKSRQTLKQMAGRHLNREALNGCRGAPQLNTAGSGSRLIKRPAIAAR
jgi:hypothetical protein